MTVVHWSDANGSRILLRSISGSADCLSATLPPLALAAMMLCFVSPLATADCETPLSPEATAFVKGMALLLLPETYSDDDDWGRTKRVQSGLNVDLDGLQLETSRRWKNVNHGTWRRVDASLVDPEERFDLRICFLPTENPAEPGYRVQAKLRLTASAVQQHWNRGLKLYSISADVSGDFTFDADVHFESDVITADGRPRVRILPVVDRAKLAMTGFRVNRVSHSKGTSARVFGETFESLVGNRVQRESARLAARINAKIRKKPERFEIPGAVLGLFSSERNASPITPEPAE